MARKKTIRCEIPVETNGRLNSVWGAITSEDPDNAPVTRSQALKAIIDYAYVQMGLGCIGYNSPIEVAERLGWMEPDDEAKPNAEAVELACSLHRQIQRKMVYPKRTGMTITNKGVVELEQMYKTLKKGPLYEIKFNNRKKSFVKV